MCRGGAMPALQELAPQGARGTDSLVGPPTPPTGQKGTWLRGTTADTHGRSEGDEGPGTIEVKDIKFKHIQTV